MKRYAPYLDGNMVPYMDELSNGPYIRYADHVAVVTAILEALEPGEEVNTSGMSYIAICHSGSDKRRHDWLIKKRAYDAVLAIVDGSEKTHEERCATMADLVREAWTPGEGGT